MDAFMTPDFDVRVVEPATWQGTVTAEASLRFDDIEVGELFPFGPEFVFVVVGKVPSSNGARPFVNVCPLRKGTDQRVFELLVKRPNGTLENIGVEVRPLASVVVDGSLEIVRAGTSHRFVVVGLEPEAAGAIRRVFLEENPRPRLL